jgi:hypothetical protein
VILLNFELLFIIQIIQRSANNAAPALPVSSEMFENQAATMISRKPTTKRSMTGCGWLVLLLDLVVEVVPLDLVVLGFAVVVFVAAISLSSVPNGITYVS